MSRNLPLCHQVTGRSIENLKHFKFREEETNFSDTKDLCGNTDPVSKCNSHEIQQTTYSVNKSMPDLSQSKGKQVRCAHHSSSSESCETTSLSTSPRLSSIPHHETRNSAFRSDDNADDSDYDDVIESDPDDVIRQAYHESNKHAMSVLITSESGSVRRKPTGRSKSDVGYRYSRNQPSLKFHRMTNRCSPELERFFDSMGLESSIWKQLTGSSTTSSPPQFFGSGSSINTDDHRSQVCSEDSMQDNLSNKDGLRGQDLLDHGPVETSIIEKKCSCHKMAF
ncbi:uncharacterized protein LOC111084330 [Limulus polyphemus]|uniref:Uncharacterized protein LOC111084330 n=1 Tax=Limulus polyphemus TaxID=6850 RepID=A0ABM1RZH5_LIMPO|nr:uncharacterized protein LOC111084330 [Limulus polyphemus]